MCSEVVLKLDSVSKHYELFSSQKEKLKKLIRDFFNLKTPDNVTTFKALTNITFEARKGEVIGVLGRNGAGKSTLLQLICGTLTPSSGNIIVNGRLSALLELGAGFNPEFTGRENIYINSAILGLTRDEVKEKFDDIVSFADIGDFIEQPVKNYSSGMFMRLAFSVSSSINPDILIIDEALAVGDAKFQAKCFRRLDELKKNGTTILLVTHSTEQITRHCSKALLIENGKMLAFGDSSPIANQYLELLFGKEKKQNITNDIDVNNTPQDFQSLSQSKYYNEHEHRWGNRQAEIGNFSIRQGSILNPTTINSIYNYEFYFSVKFNNDISNVIIGFVIKTNDGVTVFGCNTKEKESSEILSYVNSGDFINITFHLKPLLCTGDYLLSLGVVQDENGDIIPIDRRYDSIYFRVESDSSSYGIVDLNEKIRVSNECL